MSLLGGMREGSMPAERSRALHWPCFSAYCGLLSIQHCFPNISRATHWLQDAHHTLATMAPL